MSGDGKTITFKIRQGVQWHDGQGFDASDVVYSIERGVNPSDPSASVFVNRLRLIESAVAPDAQTVVVTLSEPSASLMTVMSGPGFLMYPEHIPDVDVWKESPVGTGPFELQRITPCEGGLYFHRGFPFYQSVRVLFPDDGGKTHEEFLSRMAGRLDFSED